MSYDQFLKDHICSNCHAGMLESNPSGERDSYKCPICAFTKTIPSIIKDVHKITGNPSGRE